MRARRGVRRKPPTRKTRRELAAMRQAGRIVARTIAALQEAMIAGVNAQQLDQLAEEMICSQGAVPSFKGLYDYPATICIAPNDAVVHGIPAPDIVLSEGDIVGVDLGARFKGLHADAAFTVGVGQISERAQRLLETTQLALQAGIAQARMGNRVQDISAAVERVAVSRGCSPVRVLSGHGIGRAFHEAPSVPNFVDRAMFSDYDTRLLPGMTLAIEPMINEGASDVRLDADGWTYRTADGKLSAHFEHTVQITEGEPRLLTIDTTSDRSGGGA